MKMEITTGTTKANLTTTPVRLNVRQSEIKPRHSDNYEVEISGFDLITDLVLATEILLISEYVGVEAYADNYNDDMD